MCVQIIAFCGSCHLVVDDARVERCSWHEGMVAEGRISAEPDEPCAFHQGRARVEKMAQPCWDCSRESSDNEEEAWEHVSAWEEDKENQKDQGPPKNPT